MKTRGRQRRVGPQLRVRLRGWNGMVKNTPTLASRVTVEAHRCRVDQGRLRNHTTGLRNSRRSLSTGG